MLELTLIFTTALLVGFSGALMPGPLTAVTVEHTLRRGYLAAPLVSLGHALPEVITVILLVVGLGDYLALPNVAGVIGVAGGMVLAWMAYGMIRSATMKDFSLGIANGRFKSRNSPFGDGIIATITNPYCYLWWGTIGAGYVTLSQNHGIPGVIFFFCGHILSDFIWLSLIAGALVSGKRLITDRVYKAIVISLGLFLCGFSLYFFWSGIRMIITG